MNNLVLKTTKTKELILDFRRKKEADPPPYINGNRVERVHSFKYLGILISDDLTWTANTITTTKKLLKRLYSFTSSLHKDLLLAFYHAAIESIISYGITLSFTCK